MLISVSSLLLSVALIMVGHGLQSTLIPIRGELELFSATSIGLISSSFYVGYVLGCLVGPFAIVRAGHIRAFAALISLASASALFHPLLLDEWAWIFVRVISGFCIVNVYLIIESWLNEKATNENRGLVMSAYTFTLTLGIVGGQLSTSLLHIDGFQAFVLSSIALSIAIVPVSLTKSAQPAPIAVVRFRPLKLYQTSPTAIVSCILNGLAIGALFSLLPLYASRIDVEDHLIPVVAGALMLGGLILQYPLGRLSDKVDRRFMLILAGSGSIVLSLIIAFSGTLNFYMLIFLIMALGSLMMPIYAIAAAHAYDYAEEDEMVETASGIILAFGFGSIFGPFASSFAMDLYGPEALFLVVAASTVLMIMFLILRTIQGDKLTEEEKSDYDLASGAFVGGVIAPDLYEGEDDYVLVPEDYEPEPEENNDRQEDKS